MEAAKILGRYMLCAEIASGGMATVHLGRLLGPVGFSRTVAIKRLHAQFAKDPTFVAMFLDEARLAARIHHPNVVATLDVVADFGELFLVMEYLEGESFSRLRRSANSYGERIPLPIVSAVVIGMLHGLHAAHEATDEQGTPLGIVHRDISPENVLVGRDGVPRIIDFGVAKAAGRAQHTRQGDLKGKLAYMAPEQIRGEVSRRTDVYAAGVVLWEALVGRRLFRGENEAEIMAKVLAGEIAPPRHVVPELPAELDAIVMCATSTDPARRFATARDMARALEHVVTPAAASRVGEWVERMASASLAQKARLVTQTEQASSGVTPMPGPLPGQPSSEVNTLAPSMARHVAELPASPAAPRPALSPAVYLVLGAGAMIAVGLVALGVKRVVGSPLAAPAAQASASVSQAAPSSAPSSPAPATATSPEPAALVAPPASDAPATSTPAPLAPAPLAPSASAPPRAAVPRAARCNPPYTLDALGDKHYKRECLQ